MKDSLNYSNVLRVPALLILVAILILLTSCSIFRPVPQATPGLHKLTWSKRLAELEQVKKWTISGALSINYRNKTNIASFYWQQDIGSYEIKVHGPLNLVEVSVASKAGRVVLSRSNEDINIARSAEELLESQLGWKIPVSNLVYWVKGMPAPDYSYKYDNDKYNHATLIQQQGWTIKYRDYVSINGVDLPTRIELKNKKVRMKIVVKTWKV